MFTNLTFLYVFYIEVEDHKNVRNVLLKKAISGSERFLKANTKYIIFFGKTYSGIFLGNH